MHTEEGPVVLRRVSLGFCHLNDSTAWPRLVYVNRKSFMTTVNHLCAAGPQTSNIIISFTYFASRNQQVAHLKSIFENHLTASAILGEVMWVTAASVKWAERESF